MAGKYRLTTLGCKVNQYESQVLRGILDSCGWVEAGRGECPDLVLVNSCAVTEAAMYENLRVVRRAGKDKSQVVVVGCGASANPSRFRALDHVVAVLGHDADLRAELPRQLETLKVSGIGLRKTIAKDSLSHDGPIQAAGNDPRRWDAGGQFPDAPASAARLPSSRIIPLLEGRVKNSSGRFLDRIDWFAGHQRAFLKVQDGCDAFCTYCIIPQLRTQIRWKPVDVAVREADELVRNGHKEIVLTGIFLGAYGRSTALRRRSDGRSQLALLVREIARVDGLERLRLSSLEPGDVDDELLDALTAHRNCVPHLHLPLQSGSQEVLRRMNRQYTRDEYLDMVERVRRAFDRPAISTDIIVGFPGETEPDFEAGLEIARYGQFCKIHAFPFSPREGTAAARWDADFVSQQTVRRRMRDLAQVESEASFAYRKNLLGLRERVIVEGKAEQVQQVQDGKPGGRQILNGRIDRYIEVHFEADIATARGDVVHVVIDRVTPGRTHACTTSGTFHRALPVLSPSRDFLSSLWTPCPN